MEITIKANTLSEAFRILMVARGETYRSLAAVHGFNASAVWRFAHTPRSIRLPVAIPLILWMDITMEQLRELWEKEYGT